MKKPNARRMRKSWLKRKRSRGGERKRRKRRKKRRGRSRGVAGDMKYEDSGQSSSPTLPFSSSSSSSSSSSPCLFPFTPIHSVDRNWPIRQRRSLHHANHFGHSPNASPNPLRAIYVQSRSLIRLQTRTTAESRSLFPQLDAKWGNASLLPPPFSLPIPPPAVTEGGRGEIINRPISTKKPFLLPLSS